jgi:hypothetical protein
MNYTNIVETALMYADRADDSLVVSRMDIFLRMAEARINRVLQTRNQAKRAYIAMRRDKVNYALPPDFSGMRSIVMMQDQDPRTPHHTLEYVTPQYMAEMYSHGRLETPAYTILENIVQVWPPQHGWLLEMLYYQNVTPLTEQAPRNWIAAKAPDMYIFALLVEISSFVKDAEAAILWSKRFDAVIGELTDQDSQDRWSGTTPYIRTM